MKVVTSVPLIIIISIHVPEVSEHVPILRKNDSIDIRLLPHDTSTSIETLVLSPVSAINPLEAKLYTLSKHINKSNKQLSDQQNN